MDEKLRFVSLQSGSDGNCLFVESHGIRLLVDAGITPLQIRTRLALFGVQIDSIHAVLISHAHSDHIYYAGGLQRQHGLPIWLTAGSYHRTKTLKNLGNIPEATIFTAGDTLQFGGIKVETIPTTHDAPDGVCFVVDNGIVRLGIMTDLGSRFLGLDDVVATLDGIFLESNYDPDMLTNGKYTPELQQRIRGGAGHLSNYEAANILKTSGSRLRWACLGHLSADNNRPELVLETHRNILGSAMPLHLAPRHEISDILEL